MLTPRIITPECSTIATLLADIDCKLAQLSGTLYNNMTLMLNYPVPAGTFIDLLTYKRILQYKNVNDEYADSFSVDQITDKIKLLKYK